MLLPPICNLPQSRFITHIFAQTQKRHAVLCSRGCHRQRHFQSAQQVAVLLMHTIAVQRFQPHLGQGDSQPILPFFIIKAEHRRAGREAGVNRCIPVCAQRSVASAEGIPFILDVFQRCFPRHAQRRRIIGLLFPAERNARFAPADFLAGNFCGKIRSQHKVLPVHMLPPIVSLIVSRFPSSRLRESPCTRITCPAFAAPACLPPVPQSHFPHSEQRPQCPSNTAHKCAVLNLCRWQTDMLSCQRVLCSAPSVPLFPDLSLYDSVFRRKTPVRPPAR